MRQISTQSLELQNGLASFLVGFIFLLPPAAFAVPWYQVFSVWAPESAWGTIFLVLGVIQMAMTMLDVVVLRRIAAALLGVLFCVYLLGVVSWNPMSPWIGFLLPVALGQLCAFFRARRIR